MSRRRHTGTTSHGAVWPAASPRGEGGPDARSSPAPRAGRAPLPGCRWVCPRVSRPPRRPAPLPTGRPTFSAAPRRALGAARASASSGPGPGLRARGPGGPWRSPPSPAPFPRRPPAVLLLSLGAGPRPELRSPSRCARLRPRDPVSRPARAVPPPPLAPGCLPRSGLVRLPRAHCLPAGASGFASVSLPVSLPCLSPLRVSVSLSFALSVRSPLSRTQAPAASPARPGARAPDARGARRTPNSPHAARLCETFAPPHT